MTLKNNIDFKEAKKRPLYKRFSDEWGEERVVECCDGKKQAYFLGPPNKKTWADASPSLAVVSRAHCPNNHLTIMPYRQKRAILYSEMHVKKKQYFETSIAILIHFQQLQSRAGTDPNKLSLWRGVYNYAVFSSLKFQLKLFFIISPYFCCLGQESGRMQKVWWLKKCFPISKSLPPRRNVVLRH